MIKQATRFALLCAALLLPAAGCLSDSTSSTDRAIIDTACAEDTDCPTGFECEVEVEHGTTTSFCQADHESDGTCPPGYEAEIEDGQAFCKPHGGDDADDDGLPDDGTDDSPGDDDGTGTGTVGTECATAADCAAGLECEIELEHGVTTASCQPHGGDN